MAGLRLVLSDTPEDSSVWQQNDFDLGGRSRRARLARIHRHRPAPTEPVAEKQRATPDRRAGASVLGPARPPPARPDPTAGLAPPPHLGPGQRRGRQSPAQEGSGEERELDALQAVQRHGSLAPRKCSRHRHRPRSALSGATH